MKKSEVLQIKVTPEVKKSASFIFEQMGLSTGDAVNLFLSQAIRTRSIPFDIKVDNFTDKTVAALEEIDRKITANDTSARYDNVDDALEALGL